MMRKARVYGGVAAVAALTSGAVAAPASAAPQGATYTVCSSDPLPIGHVVQRKYPLLGFCYYGPYNMYNVSDRFTLPTGLDAVNKVYDVCVSTLPATWTIVSQFDSPACGLFGIGGNTVRIKFSGTVG